MLISLLVIVQLCWCLVLSNGIASMYSPFPTCELADSSNGLVDIYCKMKSTGNKFPTRDYSSKLAVINELVIDNAYDIPGFAFRDLFIDKLILNGVKNINKFAFRSVLSLRSLSVRESDSSFSQWLIKPNSLTFLQEQISELKFIDLDRVNFYSQLSSFYKLRVLHLINNSLKMISIDRIYNILQELVIENQNFLKDNQILISQLQQLEKLSLRNNGIKTLSIQNIRELPRLKWLNFEGNDIETISSQFFSNFPLLEYVNLKRNKLYSFKSIGELYGLKFLDLSHNRLGKRTDETDWNFWSIKNMTHLYLNNNSLPAQLELTLPESLQVLDLSFNDWMDIECKDLPNLVSLSVANNMLEIVTLINMTSLRNLDVSNNLIEKVYIEYAPNLTSLNLDYNSLSSLNKLDLVKSTSLKSLNMKGNQIKELTNKFFVDLPELSFLDISGNLIDRIETLYNSKLSVAILSDNILSQVPNITFLSNLQVLDLSSQNGNMKTIESYSFQRKLNTSKSNSSSKNPFCFFI